MGWSVARRLIGGAATVWCVYTLAFLMVVSLPGQRFGSGQRRLAPEVEAALRVRYNLDNHWLYYRQFLGGALRGDFGPSFMYSDWTCTQIIASSLPVSVVIGTLSILLAVLIGVPVGVVSAARGRGALAFGLSGFVLLGISLPTFVTCSLLLIAFGVWWPIAPIGGWGSLAHLPLPAITLALPFTAYIARLTHVSMQDALGSDFVRTALAMGHSRRTVVWSHALRVAMLPVVSYLGPATAQAMTGSFVVEKLYGAPGLGQHFVNAALNADTGLVLSSVLVFSSLLVMFNLAADVLYAWLDPRISHAV